MGPVVEIYLSDAMLRQRVPAHDLKPEVLGVLPVDDVVGDDGEVEERRGHGVQLAVLAGGAVPAAQHGVLPDEVTPPVRRHVEGAHHEGTCSQSEGQDVRGGYIQRLDSDLEKFVCENSNRIPERVL